MEGMATDVKETRGKMHEIIPEFLDMSSDHYRLESGGKIYEIDVAHAYSYTNLAAPVATFIRIRVDGNEFYKYSLCEDDDRYYRMEYILGKVVQVEHVGTGFDEQLVFHVHETSRKSRCGEYTLIFRCCLRRNDNNGKLGELPAEK